MSFCVLEFEICFGWRIQFCQLCLAKWLIKHISLYFFFDLCQSYTFFVIGYLEDSLKRRNFARRKGIFLICFSRLVFK